MIIDNEKYYSASLMCRLLSVSRSAYYGWKQRPPSSRDRANQLLKAEITRVFDDEKGRAGAPTGLSVGLRQKACLQAATA